MIATLQSRDREGSLKMEQFPPDRRAGGTGFSDASLLFRERFADAEAVQANAAGAFA